MKDRNGGTGVDRAPALAAAVGDAVLGIGPDCAVTSLNAAAERLLGTDLLGRDVRTLLPPGATSFAALAEVVAADGARVPVAATELDGWLVLRDLRADRYRALVERTGQLVLVCDPDGTVTYASPIPRTPGGRQPGELVGGNGLDLVHPDDKPHARAALAARSMTPGTHPPFVVRSRDVDGRTLWYRQSVTNLLDDPAVRGLAVVVQDVTAQRRAEDELAHHAPVDPVTGALTRYALERAVVAAREHGGSDAAAALVLVEVATVDTIRVAEGQAAADQVLRLVADRLRQTAPDDLVGHLGGGTFAVLRRAVGGREEALRLAGDLLAAVHEPVTVAGVPRQLTATAGATVSRDADLAALVAQAAIARHRGALRPRAGVEAFNGGHDRDVLRWLDLVAGLRGGIDAADLRLHFQRCVRVADGAVLGAEALVRWLRPDGPLLGPDEFLAAAAAAGAGAVVRDWVLATACRAAAAWPGDQYVSVNLSAADAARPDLADAVGAALRGSGLEPHRLVVELGEEAVLDPAEHVVAGVAAVAELGVRVAIDDFGTGYGPFVYLKRLPVHTIKVGREFVRGLGRREDDDAIVASVLNLATGVGADVVAVGVETAGQHLALAHLGCPAAQGYLYGRPADGAPDQEAFALPEPSTAHRRPPRRDRGIDPVVVARVRTLAAEGASLSTIAAALNAEGLPHPKDRRWHPRAVAHVVAETVAGRRS
ncbi:MAG TPA: EAL domain-containing protein [Mycobacteriales bacterium]|jgi:PAS domain S-box-containing protein|nr:EAL domain-containing protein [Mycobacteriales bacterium]